MKKKSQNKQESHTEEIKRYLGALNEDNQSKLDIVIERITGIDENIEIIPAHCLLPNQYIYIQVLQE